MWSLCVFDTGSLVTDTKLTLEMANVVKTVPLVHDREKNMA